MMMIMMEMLAGKAINVDIMDALVKLKDGSDHFKKIVRSPWHCTRAIRVCAGYECYPCLLCVRAVGGGEAANQGHQTALRRAAEGVPAVHDAVQARRGGVRGGGQAAAAPVDAAVG
jgi:hypothetical protein